MRTHYLLPAWRLSFPMPIMGICLFLLVNALMACNNADKTVPRQSIKELDETISKASYYNLKTEEGIETFKQSFLRMENSPETAWKLAMRITGDYRLVNADSSLVYAGVALKLSDVIAGNNPDAPLLSRVALMNALSTAGFIFAAQKELELIQAEMPSRIDMKLEVWKAARILYSYTLNYANGEKELETKYRKMYMQYDDSLIANLPGKDPYRKFLEGERLVVRNEPEEACRLLMALIDDLTDMDDLYAMTAYQIAETYRQRDDERQYLEFMIKAAMSDVKRSVKEGMALPALAVRLFRRGEKEYVGKAFDYINFALKDAKDGNARMRAVSIAYAMPQIDHVFRTEIERADKRMKTMLFLLSILFVVALILLRLLYLKVVRIHANERKLAATSKLQEAYIANFIGMCSTYAERLDSMTKIVGRKLAAGQADELLKLINSGKFADDNEDFHKAFDTAYLDLYPDFIDEINTLLRDDSKIIVKEEGRLTAELRIYALLRLGIVESTRIAKILRYSVSTVYAYRNKMRNRAINREFIEKTIIDGDTGRSSRS